MFTKCNEYIRLNYIFLKNLHDLLNTIINIPVFCVDGHLRVDRDLIRLIYSSEPLDNTSSGLLVETLVERLPHGSQRKEDQQTSETVWPAPYLCCKEKQRSWVKAFGVIFAVLTSFSFFGVLFYLSKMEMLEELNEDENIFGEWKI